MPGKKMILIIEDDPDICRTLELHLDSLGYQTLVSLDGKDGLHKALTAKPDLIMLDLGLPNLPGEEICRELKKSKEFETLPIIMVTAKDTDVDRVIGRVIGADYYMGKPFDFDVLEEKIKTLIGEKGAAARFETPAVSRMQTEKVYKHGQVFVKGNTPQIAAGLCSGCGLCVEHCKKLGPGVLEMRKGAACVTRPSECISCGTCMLVCPAKAISHLSYREPAPSGRTV